MLPQMLPQLGMVASLGIAGFEASVGISAFARFFLTGSAAARPHALPCPWPDEARGGAQSWLRLQSGVAPGPMLLTRRTDRASGDV
jgi:hypothetical protein